MDLEPNNVEAQLSTCRVRLTEDEGNKFLLITLFSKNKRNF